MSKSIDIRMAQPANMKNDKFEKAMDIVERELEKAYPDAMIRVRKSTSMSEVTVFGFGKSGKEDVNSFLEDLFTNSDVFLDL